MSQTANAYPCNHAMNAAASQAVVPQNSVMDIDAVSIAFGGTRVVRDISFSIEKGGITAIMGPSGCGKSTLLKSLNRSLEIATDGRLVGGNIRYRGQDIYAPGIDPRSVRAAIGIILQRPVPFPMSILENVVFGVRFFRKITFAQAHEIAETYLTKVGLWSEVKDRLKESAHQLSGGQQQRLSLARTLANQPDLVLMDEPCSALDPASSDLIEQLMLELKRDYTIVIVTHNMSQARRVSDNAVFLYKGELIEKGPTKHIFESPRTKLAADYVFGNFG